MFLACGLFLSPDDCRPKVRVSFVQNGKICRERQRHLPHLSSRVLSSKLERELECHGGDYVHLFLPFVSQSRSIQGTLQMAAKLLPAALPCRELQSEVFAGDRGKRGACECLTGVTAPGGLEDPPS